jgi:hypothetical protein
MSCPLQADLFDCAVVDLLNAMVSGDDDLIADVRKNDLPELISWADKLAKRAMEEQHDGGLYTAYFMLSLYLRSIRAGDAFVPASLINLGEAVVEARAAVAA